MRKQYANLSGLQLIKKISEYRNERIRITKNTYGVKKLLYHIVKRIPNMMQIYECAFDEIDISNVRITSETVNNTYYTDGKHKYHFSVSKNTLYMLFDDKMLLDEINISILEDPYTYLLGMPLVAPVANDVLSASSLVTLMQKDKLCLPLYSTKADGTKFVGERSGLNQWNAKGRIRNEDEVYIPYLQKDRDRDPDFFPPKDQSFTLILPDGNILSAKVCQNAYTRLSNEEYANLSPSDKKKEDRKRCIGKAIMSNPNKDLGHWILRNVFELKPHTLVTYEMLEIFGIDCVIFTKNSDGTYSIDFGESGVYEELYNNIETPEI